MSHRLSSCLSTDFGLHLIRSFASFISSVFVCQRYGVDSGAVTGLKESSESGVECSSAGVSSRSSSSSSISNSLRYSTSSCELTPNATINPTNALITVPPAIVLTTPTGHRHHKSSKRRTKTTRSKSLSRPGRLLAAKLRLSAHLADFCASHSDDNFSQSSDFEDEEYFDEQDLADMELATRAEQMEKKLKVTEKELSYLNHKIVSLNFFFFKNDTEKLTFRCNAFCCKNT